MTFILCLIMLFFVGVHMLPFLKFSKQMAIIFFKFLMLSRNLSCPENQFLCSVSGPTEDTQMRHLWRSIHQLNTSPDD